MPDNNGGHLRSRTKESNQEQHQAFLNEVPVDSVVHREIIEWLITLPLWLDLDGIRVIHACWDDDHIASLKPHLDSQNRLPAHLIGAATTGKGNSYNADGSKNPENPIFQAVETLLKGIEIKLPDGVAFKDKYGKSRTSSRIAWWNGEGQTYRQAALIEDSVRDQLPDVPLPVNVAKGYDHDKPLFIGHYWAMGTPKILSPKIACVDYSACAGGDLVAYRWSGESELSNAGFHKA